MVRVVLCFWYASYCFSDWNFFEFIAEVNSFVSFQYEDDEGDKVVLSTDGDLSGAVNHARFTGLKVVNLVKVFNLHVLSFFLL